MSAASAALEILRCLHAGHLASFQADHAAELAAVHARTRALYDSLVADHMRSRFRRWGALSADDNEMVLEHHMARLEMDAGPT